MTTVVVPVAAQVSLGSAAAEAPPAAHALRVGSLGAGGPVGRALPPRAGALLRTQGLGSELARAAAQETTRGPSLARAGFGAGASLSALVLSLDEVLGSSCQGSGPYLRNCRVAYLPAVALGGGMGALVGRTIEVRTPAVRAESLLLGSTLGATAAFLTSTLACAQEDVSNPKILCGYDGMVSSTAVLGGLVLGALAAELVSGRLRLGSR